MGCGVGDGGVEVVGWVVLWGWWGGMGVVGWGWWGGWCMGDGVGGVGVVGQV